MNKTIYKLVYTLVLVLMSCALLNKPRVIVKYVYIEKIKVPEPVVKDVSVDEPIIIEEPVETLKYLGEFKLTGYCDCYECQEEWVGTTALGVAPTINWTIAVDPDIIPLGSYVWIDGFDNIFRAEDVGSMINSNHIDIFCSSHGECYNDIFNRENVSVYIVEND